MYNMDKNIYFKLCIIENRLKYLDFILRGFIDSFPIKQRIKIKECIKKLYEDDN